jgi:SAM-dependent methyltransferase
MISSIYNLSIQEVELINDQLKNLYGIEWFEDFFTSALELRELSAPGDWEQWEKLQQKTFKLNKKNGSISPELETSCYDFQAKEGIRQFWYSQRRPWMLDSIVAVVSLIKKYQLDGNHLDIGCGIGSLSSLLMLNTSMKSFGIDRSEGAIATCRALDSTKQVQFECSDLQNYASIDQFQLVTALDLMQSNEKGFDKCVELISKRVDADGHLVMVGNFTQGFEETFFNNLGFEIQSWQRVGGLRIQNFDALWDTKFFIHLKKVDSPIFQGWEPDDAHGHQFADYANGIGEYEERKTRAFFYALHDHLC